MIKNSIDMDFKDKKNTWQRPTLPPKGSTIGEGELNFRVRDGNGWFLSSMVTR